MNTISGFIKKNDVLLFYLFSKRIHSFYLDVFMKHITHLGSTPFSVFISAILFIYSRQQSKNIGISMVIALSFSQFIVQLVKRIVHRPRPYIVLKNIIPVNPPACRYSFPSGHTCAAFSIAFVLSKYIPALSLVFISIAVLVGLSRIYLGVHYPTDTIIGVIIAYATMRMMMVLGIF